MYCERFNGQNIGMYASFLIKAFANKSLIAGIEVGDTKTKGFNICVIRKTVTHALHFFQKRSKCFNDCYEDSVTLNFCTFDLMFSES